MLNAEKSFAALAGLLASVSTNLSIALVLGLAALPLLPHDYAPVARASAPAGPAAIEVVRIKPVPTIPAAPAPAVQLNDDDAKPGVASDAPTEFAPADSTPMVVAARRRTQVREERVERRPEPVWTNSAIATEEKPKAVAPAPQPETKQEAAQAEPPKPDVWSEAEIIAGLRECVRLFAPIAADVEVSQPLKHEQCGAPAPVTLRRIGSGTNKVEISPPATINCAMVASLHSWVEKTLQPAAQETLGTPIARLRNASGYVCRNRNGSAFNGDKLSEHARGNAIDVAGFVTADGRTIEVARFWGPTARDVREAERIAAEQAKEAKEAAKKGTVKPEPAKGEPGPTRKPSAIAARAADLERSRKDAPIESNELQKLGKGARDVKSDPKSIPSALAVEREGAAKSVEGAFLRRLHRGACRTFGTVLGPEANAAHRDHFHFDLAERRRSAFCE